MAVLGLGVIGTMTDDADPGMRSSPSASSSTEVEPAASSAPSQRGEPSDSPAIAPTTTAAPTTTPPAAVPTTAFPATAPPTATIPVPTAPPPPPPFAVMLSGAATCSIGESLAPGSSGAGVTCLEQRLVTVTANGPVIVVDDVFDDATAQLVMAFQQHQGLAVDGLVGPQTAGELGIWSPPPPVQIQPAVDTGSCHPSYRPCLPRVGDLDCGDIGHRVDVIGSDPYRLDADNDGSGCDSYG